MGNLQNSKSKKPKKSKRFIFLISSLAILGILAILVVMLGPGVMVKQATQKPTDTGTFVTRETTQSNEENTETQSFEQTPDLNQRLQVAVQNTERTKSTPSRQQNTIVEIPVEQNIVENTPEASNEVSNEMPDKASNTEPNTPPSYQEPTNNTQNESDIPPPVTAQTSKDFQFQISQNEISNMIYNGLVSGTAPAYRQSIQGVSTKISGGRAKITVALLPKHLPDAFLRRLPGITRSTSTVYLGGEMGLRVNGNNVEPQIHKVSLGNMGVPMPFIESAVRAQVQAYVKNAMRLPNGQKAQLQQVQLENGAVQLKGSLN